MKQFDGRGNHRKKEGTHLSSMAEMAADVGMSEHQTKTAVRVANIPESDFNAAIDGETPPTITALAEMGTTPRPILPLRVRGATGFRTHARQVRQ